MYMIYLIIFYSPVAFFCSCPKKFPLSSHTTITAVNLIIWSPMPLDQIRSHAVRRYTLSASAILWDVNPSMSGSCKAVLLR